MDRGGQTLAGRDHPAQVRRLEQPQRALAGAAQFRQRVAQPLDQVVPQQAALDEQPADVGLAQHAHQFVGADHRADRHRHRADAGDRGQRHGEVRAVAVDEADARALADAARDQPARQLGRAAVERGEADRLVRAAPLPVIIAAQDHRDILAIGGRRGPDELRKGRCRAGIVRLRLLSHRIILPYFESSFVVATVRSARNAASKAAPRGGAGARGGPPRSLPL